MKDVRCEIGIEEGGVTDVVGRIGGGGIIGEIDGTDPYCGPPEEPDRVALGTCLTVAASVGIER